MPPARHASHAAPRRSSSRSARRSAPKPDARPRRISYHRPSPRIRWDRIGRVGLLVVSAIVAMLYVQDGIRWWNARQEADRQSTIVGNLKRDNAALDREAHSLQQPATIERQARVLGMVQAGEHPYVITGLPNR